jgi:uncharacterized membrane protein
MYSGSLLFIFLSWNIFLAWIPFRISKIFIKSEKQNPWKIYTLLGIWLLFFPNALYIITDLVHLDLETNVPKWFDAILLFASSLAGLMMAFMSLYRVESYLSKIIHKKWMPAVMLLILSMGSFGVYLGRFLRWNSWDIINHPVGLATTIVQPFLCPLEYSRAWGITVILTAFFYLLYTSVKKMPGYINRTKAL